MHGIDKTQAFTDAALLQGMFHLRRNVDDLVTLLRAQRQIFCIRFHIYNYSKLHMSAWCTCAAAGFIC